jgi:peptidoglycan hydrolase CwlO-like protein
MPGSAIAKLVTLSRMKTQQASDELARLAQRQQDLLKQKQSLQGAQQSFEDSLTELQTRMSVFQSTLSPAAAAILEAWLERAAVGYQGITVTSPLRKA